MQVSERVYVLFRRAQIFLGVTLSFDNWVFFRYAVQLVLELGFLHFFANLNRILKIYRLLRDKNIKKRLIPKSSRKKPRSLAWQETLIFAE